MASLQAKIEWKRLRKRENKKYRFVIENSKTIAKKQQKIIKFLYGFISSQNRLEKAKKERKQNLSLRFVLTRTVTENLKKIEKKFKKLKSAFMA